MDSLEFLKSSTANFGGVQTTVLINGQHVRSLELTGRSSLFAPSSQFLTGRVQLQDLVSLLDSVNPTDQAIPMGTSYSAAKPVLVQG